MHKIAHIINPVKTKKSSDLYNAQPVTFETIKIAKEFAENYAEILLFTAQFQEDRSIIPFYFTLTQDLSRSILDFGKFKGKRKLPLIKDILDRLYNSTDAEFLIYSNVDIAVMPHFYVFIKEKIEEEYDAFVINRRTISDNHQKITDIPLMYSEFGEAHPGYDCFVFHRKYFKDLILGNMCIGTTKVGVVLIANLICRANKFKLFDNVHATFHIGKERIWEKNRYKSYAKHNKNEALRILLKLESQSSSFHLSDICIKHLNKLKDEMN